MKKKTVGQRHFLVIFAIAMFITSGFCKARENHNQEILSAKTVAKQFRVERDDKGKFWFVDPQGKHFLSIGINNVVPSSWNPRAGTQYYDAVNTIFGGDFKRWKSAVIKLLSENGFNTLASWSDGRLEDNRLYGTVCLYVAGYAQDRCLEGLRPGFEKRVRENALDRLKAHPNLDNIIGFYLDNEMPWFGKTGWDDIPSYTLLEVAIGLPAEDVAHQAAKRFLIDRYKTVQAFSQSWGQPLKSWDDVDTKYLRKCVNDRAQKDRSDFTSLVAEKFFATAARVVRELVPGKLILGARFASGAPEAVIRACGKYCDVISFNDYHGEPKAHKDWLTRYWIWGGKKPLMVTEYSWRAKENTSGNPNTGGAGAVVKTQAERAANYRSYVEDLLSYPMVIGAHWFEFADQSPQGRFDGENSNYGIVDIKHRPYKQLLAAMSQTNARIAKIHSDSQIPAPSSLPKRKAVVFQPGQHPDRPPYLDIMAEEAIADPALFHAPDASISMSVEDGATVLNYNTGNEWGCGVLFFGPRSYAVGRGPKHATDLDGYPLIILDAEIAKDVSFEILIEEAGSASPVTVAFNTDAGDDGESFKSKPVYGKGGRFTYQINLNELLPRTKWGNQKGQKRVDMHALKGLALFLRDGQGIGVIRIYSLKFSR